MKIIRTAAFLAVLALFVLTGSVIAQPAAISWSDAVGQIAGERAKAGTCVALMKQYGDDTQKARGQITYTNAKADFDAVIARLITVLSGGQTAQPPSQIEQRGVRSRRLQRQGQRSASQVSRTKRQGTS